MNIKNIKYIIVLVLMLTVKLYGETPWEINQMPADVSFQDVYFQNANYGVAIGINTSNQTVIYDSYDRGFNWTLRKNFYNVNATYASFSYANSGNVVALVQDNGENKIYKSYNGLISNWSIVATAPSVSQIQKVKYFFRGSEELIFFYGFEGKIAWVYRFSNPGWGFRTVFDMSSDPNVKLYGINQGKQDNKGIYLFGGKQDENQILLSKPILGAWVSSGFEIKYDGGENAPEGIGLIYDIDFDPIYNVPGNDYVVGVCSNGYCNGLMPANSLIGNPIFLINMNKYPPKNSYISVKNSSEAVIKMPYVANSAGGIISTENGGLIWDWEYSEPNPSFLLQSNINRNEDVLNALWDGSKLSRRLINTNLITYSDFPYSGSEFAGLMKIDEQTFSTSGAKFIRGGSTSFQAISPLVNDTKIFYKWVDNSAPNQMNPYKTLYFTNIGNTYSALYKSKLKADNLWAINNASGSKSVRDKNGNINTLHESIGGIFFTKSYNNGSDFKTEEIVNDNYSNNNQFSVSNNTSPHLNEIKKEISITYPLSPERNMIAVWENRNGNTITINTASREKTIDNQKYYWKRDNDNTFNITSTNQSFFSHPKVFSQVMGITAGSIDTIYYQMKIITYLEQGTNGNDLKAKVQYKNGSVDKNQTYTIVAGADFTDFACVSDIYKNISGTVLGFKLHYSYKKNGNIFYKKETFYYETSVSDLVRIETNEENISSSDFYYQKSNPDITLRNGAPAISYTGRYQENRSIEWDNGGSGPSTLSTTYYPVVVKYKKYGVTGWTKIAYNSNGFGTQENANVEGSKDTSAYIVNYSKNSTLFNQFVQIDGKSGYSCSPGAFSGSDAKLVRGGYKGQFGSGSNPLLLKLNYPENSRYTILHSQFSITNAAVSDGFSNLDGVIEKDNTLYSLTLGPIIASNTTCGFEDDTPPQTVQNPVEFNETMVSAVFSLSNFDTLILGAHGKYATSFGQAMQPLKYHVNLVNSTTNQIHRELFRDTINVEDSVGIEFLRGYVITDITNGSDQFYVQMIVDTVDAGDGDYMMAGVYSDDTPPEGDAPINYKTKVFFENGSNSLTSGNQIPKEYSLSQNYPNPFNPSTTIKYSLPKDGFVSLKIYDITGREVKSLAGEVKKAGNYQVQFNASNLASGVYFYRIQSNDFVMTKRMVLIK